MEVPRDERNKHSGEGMKAYWRRMVSTCIVVKSPMEFVDLMKRLYRDDERVEAVMLDWNDEDYPEEWSKEVSKAMQVFGILAGRIYQLGAK
jgi:hypothetical protein